jgi:DNA processing protein
MSPRTSLSPASQACWRCRRRAWLLSELGGPLEFVACKPDRLQELLALPDRELLASVGGRRAGELQARYDSYEAPPPEREPAAQSICRHRPCYPPGLRHPAAPAMLEVLGTTERLSTLTAAPLVAIVGASRASDYGVAMAQSIARQLAACGIGVAASLTDGIAAAAHEGSLEGRGASIAVMGGGVGVSCPARRRSLYERLLDRGCAVSELPRNCRGRRWGQLASERILVALASLTVVVEADETAGDLAPARIAQALGRRLAAVPGRVTSPLSRGTHTLLREGASLIRGAHDVLELLYSGDAVLPARALSPAAAAAGAIDAGLRLTLERVGAGCDTPSKLAQAGVDPAAVLLALTELEVMGLLVRGDGGRYLPREPITTGESSCVPAGASAES